VPLLDATNFGKDYPTREELVHSVVSKEQVFNGCAKCTLSTISLSFVVPGEIVCKMHVLQLLQTFFCNCRNSSVVG
jgi:hypothetical protein